MSNLMRDVTDYFYGQADSYKRSREDALTCCGNFTYLCGAKFIAVFYFNMLLLAVAKASLYGYFVTLREEDFDEHYQGYLKDAHSSLHNGG